MSGEPRPYDPNIAQQFIDLQNLQVGSADESPAAVRPISYTSPTASPERDVERTQIISHVPIGEDAAYDHLWRPDGHVVGQPTGVPIQEAHGYDEGSSPWFRRAKISLIVTAAGATLVGAVLLGEDIASNGSPDVVATSQEPSAPEAPITASDSASPSPSPSHKKKSSPSPSASTASASASASPSASTSHRVVLPSAPASPTQTSASPTQGEDCHWNVSGGTSLTIGECGGNAAHLAYNSPEDSNPHTIPSGMVVKMLCHPNGYNDSFVKIAYGANNQYVDYIKNEPVHFDDSSLPLSCN